ncbi:right-handed parallel beta-helix repeat-containing protein [Puniceicoccus vermicola]|uniref:Right-handed parallel beta-helix repeat-containing protein n=1 Tax=Puniceicoccus vermicola TaxID=388746 RepID=A0A7X1E4T4_9BACT|nr:right-handed parallel beta-helix repeat-containing protein [Puniceicoccus vermicola]MBC2602855.1 right-handed parallel beta-helix repeat-containing protein [Puniceicoccus vermicola]
MRIPIFIHHKPILTAIALLAATVANATNLISNGDFQSFSGDKPTDWFAPSDGTVSLEYDTSNKPTDALGSLKVTCTGTKKGQGQVIQKLKLPEAGLYYLEGWVNSPKSSRGYIQVKLYKNGKEFKRISIRESGKDWVKVGKEIDTAGSTQAAVLLRYNQGERNVGDSVWFANISLIPASERVRETPQISQLNAVPTFNSIGVYADVEGDMSATTEGHMQYRAKGEAEWRDTLGVVWHGETKQMRGSLLNLTENTEYEAKVWMTDETLELETEPKVIACTTWNSHPKIGKTIHLDPGLSTTALEITEKGTPDAWVLITRAPDSPSTLDVQNKSINAIKIINSEYIIVENLKIQGSIKDAVVIEDSSNIRIRRCDISNWGQPGTFQESTSYKGKKRFFYLDEEGNRINLQAGVRINHGANRVVVENCFIHAPRGHANSWQYGHPLGPTSIIMAMSDGNHVIRNNDLIGSEDHRFNDTIESAYNNKVQGGPYRDTDIQGNIMFFSNDDGIELDGGQMNIRMFNNWIQSSLCGISTAPTIYGPSYLYRNLIVLEGEERGNTNFAFKVGGNRTPEAGINYIFHNTVYSQSKALRGGNWGKGPTPLKTRNNVFALGDILYPQIAMADFDYDMMLPGSMDPERDEWQQNGVVSGEKFRNRDAGDYRLSANSSALDQGQSLPMINDGHTGDAPDLGAFPANSDPLFPVRPGGISALPMVANIEMILGEGPTKTAEINVIVPSTLGENWKVIANSPWIQTSPQSGPCDDQSHTLTVRFNEANPQAGPMEGAITIRSDAGYNRTVFIKGIAHPPSPQIFAANAVDLEHAGFTVVQKQDAPVPSILKAPSTRMEAKDSYIKFPVNITEPGVYYLHALTFVPGPGAATHDSMRFQIDDGEITYWPFRKTAPGMWHWQIVDKFKEEYPQKIHLTQGSHTLTIWGREGETEIAKIVVSQSPVSPEDAPVPLAQK